MVLTLQRQYLVDRVEQLRQRPSRELVSAVLGRLSYVNDAYGLRRDLEVPFPAPEARLPLQVRPLQDRDVQGLLDPEAQGIDPAERQERRVRMDMMRAGLQTPYVAVTDADEPVFVQWLLGPDQNDGVARHFHQIFPRSAADEALLEGAFTPAACRGKRVMPYAMARIAELAEPLGARYVHTFVSQDNAASLVGCERAGFSPYLTRRVVWRAFRQSVTFVPLSGVLH